MPIELEIDQSASLTTFVVTGELRMDELRSALTEVYQSESFSMKSLFDLRAGEASTLTSAEIREMVPLIEERRTHPGQARWAVVAPRDVEFGMSRMFEVFAEKIPSDMRVFRDIEAAKRWLETGE